MLAKKSWLENYLYAKIDTTLLEQDCNFIWGTCTIVVANLQTCKPEAVYIGETRRSIDLRATEHRKAAETGKWSHSGLTQHRQHCNVPFDWEPTVLSRVNIKDPDRLKHHLRVSEALWIRHQKCGPGKGLNEDFGTYVRTDAWAPVFESMKDRPGRRA